MAITVNTDPAGFAPYIVPAGGGHNAYFDTWAYTMAHRPAAVTPTVAASAATPPITVGLEPAAYEAILYGKVKPLYICGNLPIGGRIVEGPFYGLDANGDPTVSAVYLFAENANPTGSHNITQFRLRGAAVAVDGSGYLTDPQFTASAVVGRAPRIEYRTGTRTQSAFADSLSRFGSGAVAYRQHFVASVTNLPIRPFNGIIPLLSAQIEDSSFGYPSDPVAFNDALGVLLSYSRLSAAEYEINVPGTVEAMIVANKSTLLEFLQNMRQIHVHWNISFTDKMRIIDPTDFTIDAEITRSNHVRDSMQFARTDPLIVPRRLNYTYIEKDRDYEPNIVSAQVDPYPSSGTSSVEEQNIELPIISTASQATADVNVALFETIAVRSQMQADLMAPLFGTEPGDAARFADHDYISFTGRVVETQHDFAAWKVTVKVGEVLNCGADAVVTAEWQASGSDDANWYSVALSQDGGVIVAVSYTDPAFADGDLFLSTDGVTWSDKTGAGARGWQDIAISSDGQVIAATYFESITVTGVVLSTNGGASWTTPTTSGGRSLTAIAVSGNGQKILVADVQGSSSYLYVSTNGGTSFSQLAGAGSAQWRNVNISRDGSTFLAWDDTNGVLNKSTNNGTSWSDITPGGYSFSPSGSVDRFFISSDGSIIILGNNSPNTIYKSVNSGTSWTTTTIAALGNVFAIQGSDDGQTLFATDGTGISGSSDGGTTWAAQPSAPSSSFTNTLASSNDGSKAAAPQLPGNVWLFGYGL